MHSDKSKYEKAVKDKVQEMQGEIEDERVNTQRALQEMMQCKGFLDNFVRENSEKEKMIL